MSSKTNTLTQERLQYLLSYDRETGIFRWRINRGRMAKAGDIAGSQGNDCYVRIRVDGKDYAAHRLAWLYMTGEWPAATIDHENINRADNRWRNLREATNAQNGTNRHKQANNTSGFKGVYVDKTSNKFCAKIKINGGESTSELSIAPRMRRSHMMPPRGCTTVISRKPISRHEKARLGLSAPSRAFLLPAIKPRSKRKIARFASARKSYPREYPPARPEMPG